MNLKAAYKIHPKYDLNLCGKKDRKQIHQHTDRIALWVEFSVVLISFIILLHLSLKWVN